VALVPTYKQNTPKVKKTAAATALAQAIGDNVPHPAPVAPVAPAAPPGTAPSKLDPRDSQYFSQIAKLRFQQGVGIRDIEQAQGWDDEDLTTSLERRGRRLPEDTLNAKNNANKAGLFYSGALGKQLGDINTTYTDDVADINKGYTRRSAVRTAARQALEMGLPIDEAAAWTEAVGRQEGRDAANPPAEPSIAASGGKLSSKAIDPQATPSTLLSSLHSLSMQSKKSGSPQSQKNLAIYWKTLTGQLAALGLPIPKPPSSLSKYLT
jgi:hypothetical protein